MVHVLLFTPETIALGSLLILPVEIFVDSNYDPLVIIALCLRWHQARIISRLHQSLIEPLYPKTHARGHFTVKHNCNLL